MSSNTSECEYLLRSIDWAASPLGRQADWPAELRTLVGVMLGSVQPMVVVWGPQRIALYNDGYAAICGERHPAAFGLCFEKIWFDIWDRLDPIMSAAYAGQGTLMTDIELILHRNGQPDEAHFAFSFTPVRNADAEVLGMFCACTETTAEVKKRRAALSQRDRFIRVFELSPGGIAMLNGPQHIFDYVNEGYLTLVGASREIIGKPVAEAVAEVVQQGFIELLDGVYQTGAPFAARAVPIALNRGPAGEVQDRLIDLTYQPMTGDEGEIIGILVQAQDVTERLAEERHREVLAHELGHRLKNQLAMVQAIASQTLRGSADMHTARRMLSERLSVLGEAHDAIVRGGVGASNVADIVDGMLTIHDDPVSPRIAVSGNDLKIGSRPALSLSLILHELATNARKHGALSRCEGRVALDWQVTHCGRCFELTWEESGGPRVTGAPLEGSGARLIRAGLAGTADCEVVLDYRPQGLRCHITGDLATFQKEH